MTAGREPVDYVDYPYFEWYSEDNGRVVIELEPDQVEILTQPIPACESDPLDRKQQSENMANFLCGIAAACGIPETNAVTTADTKAVERAKKVIANNKIRGMKLLPKEIREQLPPLYSQDGKGGNAVVYVKYFAPWSSWTWLATEGEPVLDESTETVLAYVEPKDANDAAPAPKPPRRVKVIRGTSVKVEEFMPQDEENGRNQ